MILWSPPDVVYIGAIHPRHLSLGLLFMKAKKNVLCEKPLAMNSREVAEMVACARANDVFLMEVRSSRGIKEALPLYNVVCRFCS